MRWVAASHEVVRVELIVPLRLVVGVVHVEGIVVDALIVPLAILVEDEHLLCVRVRVDHVEVEALILLEEGTPRCCAPVIVLGHGDDLLHRDVGRFHASELKSIKLEEAGLGIELQAQDKALRC